MLSGVFLTVRFGGFVFRELSAAVQVRESSYRQGGPVSVCQQLSVAVLHRVLSARSR